MFTPDADFHVMDQGSLVVIVPQNDDARQWVINNVDVPEWAWLGPGFAVEPRLVHELLLGMQAEGFTL